MAHISMKLGVAALALAGMTATAAARDLTVVAWGGSTQAAQKKVYYGPFTAATGIPLLEDSWSGGVGVLRAKVQAGQPNWDVIQVESDELHIGCDEGLYEKPDWAALGGKGAFMKEAVSECGVGSVVWSVALAYNADRLKEGPKSWADFWNVEKFPGKRTMRRGPKYNLEFALMADGVPQADVYKVLRAPAGVDRAFRKLDELKPNLVWWTAGAQPGQLMASGEVSMAASYTSRMFAAQRDDKRNFQVVWNGSIYAIDHWVVLRGSPNRDNAMKMVQYMTRPEIQKQLPPLSFQGATNLEAAKQTDPAAGPSLPTFPANLAVSGSLDVEFWVDNIEQLTQRFNAWASK